MGQNSYTASFKLKVVAYATAQSKRAAAKYFHVDRRRVQESCQQRKELEKISKSAKRLPGSGSKVPYQDIEIKLVRWMDERREEGARVTGKALLLPAARGIPHVNHGVAIARDE